MLARVAFSWLRLSAKFWPLAVICAALPAHAIVNGKPVSAEQFQTDYPWVVAVIDPAANGICGGALIAPRWVITAAHCTADGKYVLIGNPDRSKGQRVELEKVIRHPDFDETSFQNDVGLLYLKEAVDNPVAPIATAEQMAELLRNGLSGTIFGWGVRPYGRLPGDQLYASRTATPTPMLRGSQIYSQDLNAGPCGSDSGGPLVMTTADGTKLLAGVISATQGDLCATVGGVAIYTHLAVVNAFIVEMLERFPAD